NLAVMIPFGKPFSASVVWARKYKIPLIAMPGGNVISEDDAHMVRLMRAIDLCVPLERLGQQETRSCVAMIPAAGAIASFYSAIPEALYYLSTLVQKTDYADLLSSRAVFPLFDNMPEEESFRKLDNLCRRGAEKRYGIRLAGADLALKQGRKISERLSYELSIIREKGFSGYFLVVHDIVSRCPRTTGRGSAAASIVSYLLGITHVDPLRYNLFFERFLNHGRKDPPDIDVDFPWDEREKALSYVFTRYAGHAGMVADHVTFGPRSSLREPAKALGFPEQEIGRLVSFFTTGRHGQIPHHLLAAAERLRGIPRYIGTHPGGVVITPRPVFCYTHLQVSQSGWPVIAWEKDAAEAAGLVKIDLLGNRSLGVLRDAIRLVNVRHNAGISWRRFDPLEDTDTQEFLERGETIGVFYIESPATRQLLQKMRLADFQRLVIASSIIRPAANRYIEEFVKRLHGKKWKRLHPRVEKTLRETCGIMVYQEDVSRVAIAAAGFSAEEADKLRKVLSKKAGREGLKLFQNRFFDGARRTGLSEEEIRVVWEMVMSFDGYSFCKAHSASYAQVSYRCAYLKLHYPLEFMTSVINNGGGFYTRQTYINETRRMGIAVLGPDVAKSGLEYLPEEGGMRTGLGQLVGIRRGFLVLLVEEREKHGPFVDFLDFLNRTKPAYSDLRVLIRAGALDSLSCGLFRPALFWLAAQHDRFSGLIFPPEIPKALGDYSWQQKLSDEVTYLGLLASRHPVAVFEPRIMALSRRMREIPRISSRMIPAYRDMRISIAGMLAAAKEVRTSGHKDMIFLSFEDEEGTFEAVAFPE
ncbi:MAG: DNA polymerase III subunit alpha, partial [Spirochaetaceae bacterium]